MKVQEWMTDVALGRLPEYSLIHKFGAGTVGTALVPITISGFYRTPTAATALELLSSDAADAAAGDGAREIIVEGLDSTWSTVTQAVVPNGVTPVALGTDLLRLNRWYVSKSGTYATQAAGSHAGTLTIREVSGGAVWSEIKLADGLGLGQSQIGCYTVPAGKTGWVLSMEVTVDSTKVVDVYFFQRPRADSVSAPFDGTMRIVRQLVGFTGPVDFAPRAPDGPFVGPCDIGFLGIVSVATAYIAADFEIMLVE